MEGGEWEKRSGKSADSLQNNPSALEVSVPSMNEMKNFGGMRLEGGGK